MAETFFQGKYESHLREIFPRDILGIKKIISSIFILQYGEWLQNKSIPQSEEIFSRAVSFALRDIPLASERKTSLLQAILDAGKLSETKKEFFKVSDTISRDPFYALVEDFSLDGEISREEFVLLQSAFSREQNFLRALESLPEDTKKLFLSHIHLALENNIAEKKSGFEQEYHAELKHLEARGYNVGVFAKRVARFYYKTPWKYRKYEHPKRRLRRTMKLALLQLLRLKLWNIDAQKILEQFEAGESFEDYFFILYKLLEIIDEHPKSEEIYSVLDNEDTIQTEVLSAEENKKKILQGDFLVMKIANMFSKTDALEEEHILEEGMLGKILDTSTDIVGEDVYFNREQEHAGIYAQASDVSWEQEDEEDFDSMPPETAYEILKHRFEQVEEKKRQAFGTGDYNAIDEYNEDLLDISSKLEKLSKILYLEE